MSKLSALLGKVVAANTLAVGTTVVGGVLCVLFVGAVWAVRRWWRNKGAEKAKQVIEACSRAEETGEVFGGLVEAAAEAA